MRAYLNSLVLTAAVVVGVCFTGCQEEETPVRVIETGTVTDIDGHVYKTVKIGNQWWMAENLAVSRFNDGSDLTYIETTSMDSTWSNTPNASYTFINDGLYGNLYNFSVVENTRNIAPEGWHIPTDEEWLMLEEEIGMSADETQSLGWRGNKEAEKLTSLYSEGWPGGAALFGTDEFGFNAKPGGCRVFNGETNYQGNLTFWWTASTNGNEGWYRYIDANQTRIFRQHTYKGYGMSIRCVKNS
ncbi:MAG: fibrobacter succinogenes major paralogous domain-containing protein [Sediminibacterium sp.]